MSNLTLSLLSEPLRNTIYQNEAYYHLPCYGALIAKEISRLNSQEGTVQLSYTFVLRVMIKGSQQDQNLPPLLKQSLLDNKLKVRINGAEFNEQGKLVVGDCDSNFLQVTYRNEVTLHLGEEFQWTPFDVINLKFVIEVPHMTLPNKSECCFNFHISNDIHDMITIKDDCDMIPEFDICYNHLVVQTQKEQSHDGKPHFPIAIYSFAIYRKPGNKILTVFLPLFILGIFVLSCFAIEPSLENVLPNLATLLLAYIAFLPTVRSEIPSVSYATFTDVIIYSYLCSCVVVLIYAYAQQYFLTNLEQYFKMLSIVLVFWPVAAVSTFFFFYRIKKRGYQQVLQTTKIPSSKFYAGNWSLLENNQ